MMLALGLAVTSSFKTFLLAQPMPAANPVRVAASMNVFTSLLSDMVIFLKMFFQLSRKSSWHSSHKCSFSSQNLHIPGFDENSSFVNLFEHSSQ